MSLVSELLSLAGDGGHDLEEGSVALSVLELVDLSSTFMELLLDE